MKNNGVTDLLVTGITATTMTLTFTEVDGGTGAPASYAVRLATPTITWGTAGDVTAGTCSTPVSGTTIGASKSCTVTGLSTTTPYQFQLVPYRGTLGVNPIFGPLSNITGGTTGGTPPSPTMVTMASDDFTRADNPTGIGTTWDGGYTGRVNFNIVSNAIQCTVVLSNSCFETYNALTLPSDHFVQAILAGWVTTGGVQRAGGVGVASTAPATFTTYLGLAQVNAGGPTSIIQKRVGGVATTIFSDATQTWAPTDTIRLEVRASTGQLAFYRNTTLIGTVADADIATAGLRGGLFVNIQSGGATSDVILDSFTIGNFSVATVDLCGCDNH